MSNFRQRVNLFQVLNGWTESEGGKIREKLLFLDFLYFNVKYVEYQKLFTCFERLPNEIGAELLSTILLL